MLKKARSSLVDLKTNALRFCRYRKSSGLDDVIAHGRLVKGYPGDVTGEGDFFFFFLRGSWFLDVLGFSVFFVSEFFLHLKCRSGTC